ncbi:PQQ-binding-like beta-propeller repeat protein [Parapedobacter pyrenivorans]|uniref:outer membrane protein assembly factor BamB family protein n=1 Tax=Parapedobacter pyrenivorans TaxID=1305674 RepID=UPI0033416388
MTRLKALIFYTSSLFIFIFLGCSRKEGVSDNKKNDQVSRLENFRDWGIYRGDKKATQYSELDQINTENIHLLEKAWEYQYEGDAESPGIYSNPIIIDGLLYFNTPRMETVALDAATGEEVWVFDPAVYNDGKIVRSRSRGLVYWEDENGNNQRIFSAVRDRLYAMDAKTGKLIEPFGQFEDSKFIDLRHNLPIPPELADIEITTQGVVYKDFLIIPGRQPEGNSATPGDIRAYNALTGEFKWIFNTIPLPGQFGYDTWKWEEDMIYGAANPWGGLTVDEERGWVFAATGSAAGEFIYGGSRIGENLFANCVLALDATTGERKWHYQVIHHDIWDYDLPPSPMLVTTTTEEGTRDVVVQMGKLPFMFILDRDTGEPVFPVLEMPVPAFGGVPGEQPYPTQPWPIKPPPLVRTAMFESDITDITPESHAYVLEQFKKHRTGPVYTPASVEGTITTPGIHGSVEWPGGAFDPATNVVFVAVNELPTVHTLTPIAPDSPMKNMTPVQRGASIYNTNCAHCHGINKAGNPPFPALNNLKKSDREIKEILENGYGEMPSFSNLSDDEKNSIIAYLNDNTTDTEGTGAAPTDSADQTPVWSGTGSGGDWKTTTPQYINRARFFVDHMGFPAIKPPWGQLIAVDVAKGEILWKVPLGEYPELVKMGIRNTGTEVFGGPVVTAGNIIFVAGTPDEKIRAFSKHDGALLWEYKLPAGGYATPSVYMINGKQYVVIAAGGSGKLGTPPGKSVIAFAIP